MVDVVERCVPSGLSDMLRQIDVHRLLHRVHDHVWGEHHRTELLDYLTRREVAHLDTDARAALVDGLQHGITRRPEERAICSLFVSTRGDALTDLKNRVDAGGDFRDLEHLVFHEIDNPVVRAEMLGHIAGESVLGSGTKVISDIDDTLFCSLKDERYPRKTVYPGVRQFYRELDLADGREGDLTFLTARPGEPSGKVENAVHHMLRRRGLPEAPVITGTLGGLINHEHMAETKLQGLARYRAVFPEYGAVLIGDSGQGDVLFGERAVAAQGDAVRGVLIHDVKATPDDERARLRAEGVVLFDTYVDAAVEAFGLGLLSRDAVQRVADAATREMAAIRFDSPAQREARMAELTRALDRVAGLGGVSSR